MTSAVTSAMTSWARDIATIVCKPLPLVLLIGLGAMVACDGPAPAQGYPNQDIKLIVPFPPGGVTDLNARILARHLTRLWGQPLTVSNMSGGGGTDGTMFVLGSPKDGYTMMMSATGQAPRTLPSTASFPTNGTSPLWSPARASARWFSS
jgi:tripartite-type tricarboxylate transporter receptor subunit TctC